MGKEWKGKLEWSSSCPWTSGWVRDVPSSLAREVRCCHLSHSNSSLLKQFITQSVRKVRNQIYDCPIAREARKQKANLAKRHNC